MPPHNEDKIIEEVIKKLSSGEIKARSSAEVTTAALERKQETFFNAQLLKFLGVAYGILAPFLTWIVLSVFEMRAELAIQKEKIGTILEIKQDISAIKQDIKQLTIDVSVLKSKGTQ